MSLVKSTKQGTVYLLVSILNNSALRDIFFLFNFTVSPSMCKPCLSSPPLQLAIWTFPYPGTFPRNSLRTFFISSLLSSLPVLADSSRAAPAERVSIGNILASLSVAPNPLHPRDPHPAHCRLVASASLTQPRSLLDRFGELLPMDDPSLPATHYERGWKSSCPQRNP